MREYLLKNISKGRSTLNFKFLVMARTQFILVKGSVQFNVVIRNWSKKGRGFQMKKEQRSETSFVEAQRQWVTRV